MCTAVFLQTPTSVPYFGRTMDFSYPLDPEIYFCPAGYKWQGILLGEEFQTTHRFMGIGQNLSPVTFAEGVNERGFAVASLYFPGYAQYDMPDSTDSTSVTSTGLLTYLLGNCACVDHAASILPALHIVGVKDAVTHTVAPLHWIMADSSGACMVIEKDAQGLHLIDNPIGVLSNSPDFTWHMTNLRNYACVTPQQEAQVTWNGVTLTPFGQGAGTLHLPGDYTPPSRFVRTAYMKCHTLLPREDNEAVPSCFHILESVSIPKGCVMTSRQTPDYTQYTSFINLASQEYFFRTYRNSQITAVPMPSAKPDTAGLLSLGKLNHAVSFRRLS